MGLLNREAILAADDLPYEDVPVPEWGGTVRIRTLSGTERDAFEAATVVTVGQRRDVNIRNIRARLVAAAAVDEQGKQLFSAADVKELGKKSGRALDRLFDVASKLSGMSARDVEELAGNSAAETSDGSTSA